MSKATGAKEPSESQKAKALWALKAAKDRVRYTMIQLVMKTFWEEKRHVWSGAKRLVKVAWIAMACSGVGTAIF